MEALVSITDELMEWWVRKFPVMDKELHKEFAAIAMRIDVAHRSALEKLAAQLDESEDGWVRLPVDADGVPIKIGDYMHCDETGSDFPCRGYCCSVGKDGERRWTVECSYDTYSGTSEYVSARRCHHYHEPTVEDVLREFAREIDADAYGITDAKVAEFAAKLRLANSGE